MSRTVKDNRYAIDKVGAKERANNARRNRLRDLESDQEASFYTSQALAHITRTRTTRTPRVTSHGPR